MLQPLTVRDMFGKQLIQMRELTAERAKSILTRYPTPLALMAKYDQGAFETPFAVDWITKNNTHSP